MECKNWQHNGCWLNYDDNMHVTLFKTSFRLWFNAKKFHLHKHAFLQMLLMHFYIMWFHPQSDYDQSYLVQKITMQICIAWIFHDPICNLIKGAIPIKHLCFKCNSFLISKSSIATTNLASFTGTTIIM